MHLLATGRYVTVLSGTTLHYNAKRWSLKRLPIDLGVPAMPITVFTLKGRTIAPVTQAFVEHTRALAKSDLR